MRNFRAVTAAASSAGARILMQSSIRSILGSIVALTLAACSPPTGPITFPNHGSIEINTTTTGANFDPAGLYTVRINGGGAQFIFVNGSLTYTNQGVGNKAVELTDIPGNCAVTGQNPQTFILTRGETAVVAFSVSCT